MWPCAKEVSVCTRALELPFYDVNAVALDRDRTKYLYAAGTPHSIAIKRTPPGGQTHHGIVRSDVNTCTCQRSLLT